MSTKCSCSSGYTDTSRLVTAGISASTGPATTGIGAPDPLAFCRIWATIGEICCTPLSRTTEYVGAPPTCGVDTTVPTGAGASANRAGSPARAIVGTVNR